MDVRPYLPIVFVSLFVASVFAIAGGSSIVPETGGGAGFEGDLAGDILTDTTDSIIDLGKVLNVTSGNVTNPGLFFDGDSNTGIYKYGNDSWGWSSGGVHRWYFDNTTHNTTLGINIFKNATNAPTLYFNNDATTGFYGDGNKTLRAVVNNTVAAQFRSQAMIGGDTTTTAAYGGSYGYVGERLPIIGLGYARAGHTVIGVNQPETYIQITGPSSCDGGWGRIFFYWPHSGNPTAYTWTSFASFTEGSGAGNWRCTNALGATQCATNLAAVINANQYLEAVSTTEYVFVRSKNGMPIHVDQGSGSSACAEIYQGGRYDAGLIADIDDFPALHIYSSGLVFMPLGRTGLENTLPNRMSIAPDPANASFHIGYGSASQTPYYNYGHLRAATFYAMDTTVPGKNMYSSFEADSTWGGTGDMREFPTGYIGFDDANSVSGSDGGRFGCVYTSANDKYCTADDGAPDITAMPGNTLRIGDMNLGTSIQNGLNTEALPCDAAHNGVLLADYQANASYGVLACVPEYDGSSQGHYWRSAVDLYAQLSVPDGSSETVTPGDDPLWLGFTDGTSWALKKNSGFKESTTLADSLEARDNGGAGIYHVNFSYSFNSSGTNVYEEAIAVGPCGGLDLDCTGGTCDVEQDCMTHRTLTTSIGVVASSCIVQVDEGDCIYPVISEVTAAPVTNVTLTNGTITIRRL